MTDKRCQCLGPMPCEKCAPDAGKAHVDKIGDLQADKMRYENVRIIGDAPAGFGDYEPAFPVHDGEYQHAGLSVRDWFAGMALQGLLATGDFYESELLYEKSYGLADAMMKERGKL